jgi:hypothetical protein
MRSKVLRIPLVGGEVRKVLVDFGNSLKTQSKTKDPRSFFVRSDMVAALQFWGPDYDTPAQYAMIHY